MSQPTEPVRALVVAAHPDDPEFGCGGTVATWVDQGIAVYYLLCTRGDKGTSDPEMTPERLMALRMAEQRAAAAVLGVREVFFLDFPDGELQPDLRLREAIVRMIRTLRPQIVATHDPATLYSESFINHPDHRAVGQATLDAIYPTARDRLNFPEHERAGLQPHKVREVYLWGSQHPNTWVDISRTLERKIAALRCHRTQIRNPDELATRLRERARQTGQSGGLELAEAFWKITLQR